MIVDNFLLPRFLILELLCACHWFEYTKAVDVLTCEARESGAKKGIYELREILNSDNKVSYKFSAVKQGAQGLKEFLEEENLLEDEEGCRFSLQGQHWKFPPLLFDSSGGPILPADSINNTDMEVNIGKGGGGGHHLLPRQEGPELCRGQCPGCVSPWGQVHPELQSSRHRPPRVCG